MKCLWLYTTLGCHLCEQLEARLMPLIGPNIRLERIEIAEDSQLIERYGERIPVLKDEEGREFAEGADTAALAEWLEKQGLINTADDTAHQEASELTPATQQNGRRVLG